MTISKIVSGGQTGVDRAALDVAIDLSMSCGGWCPQGRTAEDGVISQRYPLRETPSSHYAQRTEWNVRDTDGTLIIYQRPLAGGTLLTRECAMRMHKPCFLAELEMEDVVASIVGWINAEKIGVLNVAGPRESQRPGIYGQAYALLSRVLSSVELRA